MSDIHLKRWNRRLARKSVMAVLAFALVSCAGSVTQNPPGPAGPPEVVTLPGLVFSGVLNEPSAPQVASISNTGPAPLLVSQLALSGSHPEAFEVLSSPSLPVELPAGGSLEVEVRLAAGGDPGVKRATLEAVGTDLKQELGLSGLRARGLEGDNEPPLAQIVEALGYAVNVGSAELRLGTQATLLGEEIEAPLFQPSGTGAVTLQAVARYSPDGPAPFGWYAPTPDGPRLQGLGALAAGQYQTLKPLLQEGSQTTFDPGGSAFGIYLGANGYAAQNTYTQDTLNTGNTRHAVRVYPLRDAAGRSVPDSYLLCFEPADNGDYQDAVFVLSNVRAVSSTRTWQTLAAAPFTLYEGQGAAVDGRLYVFGGFDRDATDGQPISTWAMMRYDLATDSWSVLPDIPEKVTHAGVTTDGNVIYVAGGFVGDHPGPQTANVWKFNPADKTWTPLTPLPEARGAGVLVLYGTDLHYFGGTVRDARGIYLRDTGEHWALSLPGTGSWRRLANLPNPSNHLGGAVVGGLIYAVGGQHLGHEDNGNQSDLRAYDPAADRWTTDLAPIPIPLGHLTSSTVELNGRLVIVGGVTQGEDETATVFEYDPASNSWSSLTPLPSPRQSPIAVVVNGALLVATGATSDGPTNTTWISR